MKDLKNKRIEEMARMEKVCEEYCKTQSCGDRDCHKCGLWALAVAGYAPRNEVLSAFADDLKATLLKNKDRMTPTARKAVDVIVANIDKLLARYIKGATADIPKPLSVTYDDDIIDDKICKTVTVVLDETDISAGGAE